jgi:hypothetical protein
MNKHWQSSQEKAVQLVNEDPATFALYLELLYKDQLPVVRPDPDEREVDIP